MEILELKLITIAKKEDYTIGRLYINGEYLCDTLEDPVRILTDINKDNDFDEQGEGKIYGKTAIPEGVYEVLMTYSNKFKKIMPLLLNVKGWSGVRIHSGNTAEDTLGCILVGKNTEKGRLTNSRVYTIMLYTRIQNAVNQNLKIRISIIR